MCHLSVVRPPCPRLIDYPHYEAKGLQCVEVMLICFNLDLECDEGVLEAVGREHQPHIRVFVLQQRGGKEESEWACVSWYVRT